MTEKKTEPKFKDVMEVLHHIQKSIKAPKSNTNEFGKYKYRSCEDIVEALKSVMPEGATAVLNDDIINIGNRYYVKATATLSFGGKDYVSSAFAREPETKKGSDESQITGAASSYARKYALNGLLLIDDTKDADATHDGKVDPKNAALNTLGNSMMSSVDRLTQEQMRNSALTLLNACATPDKLKEIWVKNYKAWGKLDKDLFDEIEVCKDHNKKELEQQA